VLPSTNTGETKRPNAARAFGRQQAGSFRRVKSLEEALERARAGGPERHREKSAQQGKLPVRERIARLVDQGSFAEEALLANWENDGFGADGVVTGMAQVAGRPVCVMANDPTVKAGSWGPKTVEKIIRIQEQAYRHLVPMVYLVDSAGARITDQVQMFPGRRGAGRIFHTQVRMSGVVPQVCVLFGPSAAGGAYIPSFCDVVIMRDGNASMYLGSPRMAEMVIGEKVSLEEMGGARMHTGVSGVGHFLVKSDEEGIDVAKRYLSFFPTNWRGEPPAAPPAEPVGSGEDAPSIRDLIPADENKPFDMTKLIDALVDEGSFLEVHKRWAKELVVGYARVDGRAVGIVANQPKQRGGVLFVDSADKAARFIWTCNAFNIPLLFLADVPGFMIGTAVERQGIIRHGAKMISAVSEATVPKLSVIVRKAYGAGLYAMAGPAFEPDACIALPGARIAVMGPQAAINAVYYNQVQAISDPDERAAFVEKLRAEYAEEIDILHLASELVIDAVVQPEDLRGEIARRFELSAGKQRDWPAKNNPVTPV
jgi:acetyl-CoA carboxylase carboxyltransferase component